MNGFKQFFDRSLKAEHIGQWETALAGDCAMDMHYVVSGRGDEKVDDTEDYTKVDWFQLDSCSDLGRTVELYAQIDDYRKACEAHGVNPAHTGSSVLYWLMRSYYGQRFLICSEAQLTALGENAEQSLSLCRVHELHLVRSLPEHRFYDYVSGDTYEIYVGSTFMGGADDAATHGALYLQVVENIEEGDEHGSELL